MKEWICHNDEYGDKIVTKELVRCKDCEMNNQCSIQFKFADAENPGDWFCAYGKRKSEQKQVTGVQLNSDGTWTAVCTHTDYDPIWD